MSEINYYVYEQFTRFLSVLTESNINEKKNEIEMSLLGQELSIGNGKRIRVSKTRSLLVMGFLYIKVYKCISQTLTNNSFFTPVLLCNTRQTFFLESQLLITIT